MAIKTRAAKLENEKMDGRGGQGPTGPVTFLVGCAIAAFLYGTNSRWSSWEASGFVSAGFCLWLPLIVILLFLRQEPSHFGLTRGDRRLGLKWALLLWIAMLLPVAWASHQPPFENELLSGHLSQALPGVGPVYEAGHVHPQALLSYELGLGFVLFCGEFFFRGFFLFGLQKTRLGSGGAVLVQSLPFLLLHLSRHGHAYKSSSEALVLLPVAWALGILAIRTRSFLYGWLAYWAVSLTLDLFLLAPFIFRHFG